MRARFNYPKLLPALLLSLSLLGACSSGPKAAQSSERQVKAQAMFAERCKTAGEKIYQTVENVEGINLMKLRPGPNNFGDQFKLDDPYGRDLHGDGYIESLLRDSFQQGRKFDSNGGLPRLGYLYVEAQDPKDGQRYRYTGGIRAVRKKDITAPNVQLNLKNNPNYDLNVYEFVLDKTLATGKPPRYGVTYDDISTREEREYWIAGSSLKVVDLQSNQVIAERIGYMVDWAQGSQAGGRSPWLFAADNACPNFHRWKNPKVVVDSASAQIWQTLDFVEKVLKPSK